MPEPRTAAAGVDSELLPVNFTCQCAIWLAVLSGAGVWHRPALAELGVAADRIYVDYGLTGTSRAGPGLNQALAAVAIRKLSFEGSSYGHSQEHDERKSWSTRKAGFVALGSQNTGLRCSRTLKMILFSSEFPRHASFLLSRSVRLCGHHTGHNQAYFLGFGSATTPSSFVHPE